MSDQQEENNTQEVPPLKTKKELRKLSRQFNFVVMRARLAIFWERAWPRVVPPLCVGGSFITMSALNGWEYVPPQYRPAALAGFAILGLISPLLFKTENPFRISEKEVLRRIDGYTGDPSRPAQTLRAELGADASDTTSEVWRLHLDDLWGQWGGKFRAGTPHPGVPVRDPWKIRYLIAALAIATTAIVGPQVTLDRMQTAMDWHVPPAPVMPVDYKAVVIPPESMDMAPINNAELAAGSGPAAAPFAVHESSTLSMLVFSDKANVTVNGAGIEPKKVIKSKGSDKQTLQYEVPLDEGSVSVVVENGPQWTFNVTPDHNPAASLDDVRVLTDKDNNQKLEITYTLKDDFGVRNGEVQMRLPGEQHPDAKPLDAGRFTPVPVPVPLPAPK